MFNPRVLNAGPLLEGAGIFTPCCRRQVAKWVRAVRKALCWAVGATVVWLDAALECSDRSRSAICARALALWAFVIGALEPGELGLVALEVAVVEFVPVRREDEPLCAVPDEPPQAVSPVPRSAKVTAKAARRPEISILRITFLCRCFPLIAPEAALSR